MAFRKNTIPKIKYQYQLRGLYESCSNPTDRTEVSYDNLKPGKYQFKVKAMNSEGIWSKEFDYSFTIRPPWWNTWWFYLFVIILSVSLIYSYIKWRERELEHQKIILERKVEKQTFELKQKNDEMRVKNEELQTTNSEKDKFLSIISHDVRGPLGSFIGLTELMADGLQLYTMNEIQQMAESMKNSAANLFDLLGNLLEWARMQRGLVAFNPEKLILKDVFKESSEIFNQLARNKLILILVDIPDNLTVFADKNMLGSIVRNLVSNAIKFTHKGGEVSINAKATENNCVEISVTDTGIGMKKEMVSNLFRIDTNISRPGTDGEPSTGLGLLLCKDFVEKQGGRIWAESEVGKGSTFYFTLNSSE